MKNRIIVFISIFIIIQFIFSIKSIAIESSTNPNYTNEQIAIREVANAYYNKGIFAQYSGQRRTLFYSPEAATPQHNIYSVCSNFTYLTYYQAFGIIIPRATTFIMAYAKQYYDIDNILTNDVIEYWERTNNNGNKIYTDNNENLKEIDLSTENGRKEYATKLLTEYKLQVGDVICYHSNSTSGHALLVYDIIYDERGNPIDAIIRESTGNHETYTNKITKGLSYTNLWNEKNSIYEGTFQERYLLNDYISSSDRTRKSVLYNAKNVPYFAILRPLLKDKIGNYTGKYYYATFTRSDGLYDGYVCTKRTLTEYEITDSTKSRLNYSGIDIEKTVDVFNNSNVCLGDILEYKIKITNKSKSNAYSAFNVVENIGDYVEVFDTGNGRLDNNTLVWNIENLVADESVEIKYKVKIKENNQYLGKKIVSTGTVAGIASSTITNYISNNLTTDKKIIIKEKVEEIFNSGNYSFISNSNVENNETNEEYIYDESKEDLTNDTEETLNSSENNYGQELVLNIYKNSFGINLEFENFKIPDLIKTKNAKYWYPEDAKYVSSIYLNKENVFYNMILCNYYGALYNTSNSISLKDWENSIEYLGNRSQRADNIYEENMQTGDILIYQNNQTTNDNVVYQTEDGTYYLIYISKEDKIGIDGKEIYGFIGINGNNEIINIYRNESDYETYKDYSVNDLRTLLGKDYYVILRPSMTVDLVPMKLQINYDTNEITNQHVKAMITSNEEMLPVESWTLSEDKKVLTKTYTENTDEELKVYDYGGNEKIVNIKIENIDKEKPILDVNYSTTKATNKDVIVTINSNEEIKSVSGWTLSENKKILTKTYTENKSENIKLTDLAGNISTAVIDIKNIDKEKPVVEVKYSTTEKTLEDVIVTIEANEELQEVEGWQLSDDKKILTKTYTKNGEENITIYDLAGNSIGEAIKVENIDKEKPEYEVKYSTTLSTNEDVTVTITANEEIQSVEGWTLSEDKKVLTKTYTENTEEEVIIKDLVGNSASKTIIKINNIDKIKPEINISYSITELTNQDIIVTITANEEIKEIEGWNLSTDKKVLTRKFTSNTEENITISDLARNTIFDTIKISNIDKVAPKIEVKYSTTSATDKDVIVTITSDKIIRNVDGWTLSNDKKQLTKTSKENGEEQITITDEAGNSVTTNIKVSNIDKTESKQVDTTTIQNDDTKSISNNDTTTAKMILPNTGEKNILIFIVIFMILSTIMYIKLKKYKDVK